MAKKKEITPMDNIMAMVEYLYGKDPILVIGMAYDLLGTVAVNDAVRDIHKRIEQQEKVVEEAQKELHRLKNEEKSLLEKQDKRSQCH